MFRALLPAVTMRDLGFLRGRAWLLGAAARVTFAGRDAHARLPGLRCCAGGAL